MGNSIVEEQSSLIAFFRDFHYFWKMSTDEEFNYRWCFISMGGPISNPVSRPNVSAWPGTLPLASKGAEGAVKMVKDGVGLMIFYHLPKVFVVTAENGFFWETDVLQTVQRS